MQRYDIFASQLYANGHRPKKSAKKLWITYKIVNNLALDGRKVPFLGAIATGPQLLNEGRAAVDPTHQVVDSHVALGVREKFVGEVVLADVVFLHDRCLISSFALSCLSCLSKSLRMLSDLPGNLCKSLAGVLFHLVGCAIEGFGIDLGTLFLDDKPSVALAAMSLGEPQP